MPKVGVVLSGCGAQDGAEIHESVITLLALDRAGAEVTIMAPDMNQFHVINHLNNEEIESLKKIHLLSDYINKIDKEINSCKENPIDLEEYLNELFPQLNESGRETIIKVAYWVSIADGEVDKREEKLLIKMAKHFQISSAHLRGIISEVNETVSG